MLVLLVVAIFFFMFISKPIGYWIIEMAGPYADMAWLRYVGELFVDRNVFVMLFMLLPFIIVGTRIWASPNHEGE